MRFTKRLSWENDISIMRLDERRQRRVEIGPVRMHNRLERHEIIPGSWTMENNEEEEAHACSYFVGLSYS